MSIQPFQEKILKQLINQEVQLSRLYAIFSKQFPQDEEFWEKLSKEENRHAKLIEKLYAAAKTGTIVFDEGKIKTYTLEAFLNQLEGIIEKAERGEIKHLSAFSYAVDYESSLIEKNVFTHFDSLSERVRKTLKILQTETINHVDRIRNARKAVTSK